MNQLPIYLKGLTDEFITKANLNEGKNEFYTSNKALSHYIPNQINKINLKYKEYASGQENLTHFE